MNWIKMDNTVGTAQEQLRNWHYNKPCCLPAVRTGPYTCLDCFSVFCFLRILTLTRYLEFKWETEKCCSCVFLVLQHWHNISGYVLNKIWPAVLQYNISVIEQNIETSLHSLNRLQWNPSFSSVHTVPVSSRSPSGPLLFPCGFKSSEAQSSLSIW